MNPFLYFGFGLFSGRFEPIQKILTRIPESFRRSAKARAATRLSNEPRLKSPGFFVAIAGGGSSLRFNPLIIVFPFLTVLTCCEWNRSHRKPIWQPARARIVFKLPRAHLVE